MTEMTWTTRIKRHGGQARQGPAERLGICVRSVLKKVEVNLVDPRRFEYGILMDCGYLANDSTADAGERYRAQPKCERAVRQ